MSDSYARTPVGLFDRINQRIGALESRLARILPDRLSPGGSQVTDWNFALDDGFYWGNSPLNSPDGAGDYIGLVRRTGSRLVQEVSKTDFTPWSRLRTWRRSYDFGTTTWTAWNFGPGSNLITDLNTAVDAGFYHSSAAANQPDPTGGGTLIVQLSSSGGQILQEFRRNVIDATTGQDYRRFVRQSTNGGTTWSAWTLMNGVGLYRSASTLALSTTSQVVPFDSYDVAHPSFSYSAGTWTCTVPGYYEFAGAMMAGIASAAVAVVTSLLFNGTTQFTTYGRADAVSFASQIMPRAVRACAVGDTVRFTALRGGTGTVSLTGATGQQWLSIRTVS